MKNILVIGLLGILALSGCGGGSSAPAVDCSGYWTGQIGDFECRLTIDQASGSVSGTILAANPGDINARIDGQGNLSGDVVGKVTVENGYLIGRLNGHDLRLQKGAPPL